MHLVDHGTANGSSVAKEKCFPFSGNLRREHKQGYRWGTDYGFPDAQVERARVSYEQLRLCLKKEEK